MRDRAAPRKQRRRPPPLTSNPLESPIGPPPRRRPLTRAERRQQTQVEHTLTHATRTGRALTPAESRRAVKRYGFLAANMIEMGLRHIAGERERQQLARSAPNSRSADIHPRHRGLAEKVSTMGLLPGDSPGGRLVNLLTSIPREAAGMGIGLGQLAGRGGYDVTVDVKNLAEGDPTFKHTRETAKLLGKGVVADYRSRYGADFQQQLEQRGPLPYLLDIVGGAGAVTRAGSIARGASEARAAGVSPLEAIRQGYRKSISPIDPRLVVPGHARTLPIGERDIPLTWSRSPMGRYFQRLSDDASLRAPDQRRIVRMTPTGVPILTRGANIRAARRSVRLERQQERRARVAQARNVARVRHPSGRFKGKKAADVRLFWESNLPESFRGNAGLQAVRDHLDRLRNSPRRVRDLEPTARLVAARAKHERLLRRSERAVGANKERIRKELDKAGADMRGAEDSVAVISRRNAELVADPAGAITRARARLGEVEKTIEDALKGIEADLKERMGGKFDPSETMRRTSAKAAAEGKRGGKRAQSRGKLAETRTQAQELRDDAWAQLQRYAERDDDVGRTVKGWLDEHDQLRDLIDAHEERHLFRSDPTAAEASRTVPTATEDIPSNLGRGTRQGLAGRLGGATSVSADELQALERRHLSRIGQSVEQLQKNLGDLNERIARAGRGTKTRAALEERAGRLQDAIDQAQAFTAARGYLAHEQLGRRIEELDQAMQHTPDDRYHAALAAAEAITSDLESITGAVLGPEKIGLLERRRGLMGRMLGLEDVEPSRIYAPHRETKTSGRIRDTAGLGAPRGRRISGKASTTNLGLRNPNRGILVETGRVDPSLDHLIVQWGRAQSWRFVQNIRDLMYDGGEDIAVGSAPRPGWYVVDRKSRANQQLWENAELGDDAALHAGLQDFVENSIWREGDRTPPSYQDMRQVNPTIVEEIFREAGVDLPGKTGRLRQSLETGGAPFDLVNGLVRTSVLYANPGYYPANFIGNLVFMGLHQHGFALPNVIEAGRTYFKDRQLFDLISGEVGMGPTEALSAKTSTGAGLLDRTLNLERRATHVAAAIPDNWPRVAAWFYEAKNAGFKTPAQMRELLTSTDEQTRALRQQVSDRSVEAMVNFERTSPLERSTLGRVFFVWPWIRGATAWAAHYMKEFPERTAAIAPVATQEHQHDLEPYKHGLPAYLQNIVPLNRLGSKVLNVGSVSPSATAAQLVQTFAGTVNAVLTDTPPPKYNGLGDMINPLLDFIWYTLHSETSFGEKVGQRTALTRNALELSPAGGVIAQATGHQPVSKIYTDEGARALLERRFGRVMPFGVDPQAIAERAAQDSPGPAQTPQSRMDDYLERVKTLIGEPPESIRRARRNQMLYEQAAESYKQDRYGSTRHKISEREEAAILLSVDASQRPGIWDPQSVTRAQLIIRNGPPASVRAFISHDRRELWEKLLGPLSTRLGAAARAKEARDYARSHSG